MDLPEEAKRAPSAPVWNQSFPSDYVKCFNCFVLPPDAWHQVVPICTEWWCTEANEATQTHCYNPVAPAYLIWVYYAHGRQRRCQEDPVGLPSGRLEKTTGSSPHHMAQHHSTGSETSPSYAPRSSRFGSEPPSVEDDVDVYGATQSWVACQKRRWRVKFHIRERQTFYLGPYAKMFWQCINRIVHECYFYGIVWSATECMHLIWASYCNTLFYLISLFNFS